MALTVRTNGSGGSNQINSTWFNDFLNLLTGAMQDQNVNIKNTLTLSAIGAAPSAAATGAVVAGAGMGIGAYVYAYTYASQDGESALSPTTSVTTTSGNQNVNLTAITVGPTGTTARKIYRTPVGGGTNFKLLTTLADNTTTTFSDTTADASLGAAPPTVPTFGGALIIKDSTGAVKLKINNDGSLSNLTVGGRINGGYPPSQTLVTGSAVVLPTTGPNVTLTCAASITGVTLPNGINPGDTYFLINTSGTGFTISFAGTNIRDVGNVGINAGHLGTFIWDGTKWYART